jgi:hypothetical protein
MNFKDISFTILDQPEGYTNVLKIDLKCPEKYIKAYIFFIIQWIEFKFENPKYISIYVTIIFKKIKKR